MKKLLVIVGPTASGKTALSVKCAQKLNGQIVSADSIAVYKGMEIGSARPSNEEMCGIPHYMIGNIDPRDNFTVADFQLMARECIDKISEENCLPMLVGGTGLYVNSVISTLNFTSAPSDQGIREEWIERELSDRGCAHRFLLQVDPATAQKLHPNDVKRVIRAIEVYNLTGRPMSAQIGQFNREEALYDLCMVGLTMPREMLYVRIELRVELMVKNGLIEEVKSLLDSGIDPSLSSMQGLGYKEIVSYLEGKCTLEEAIEKIKLETRHFAKRQLTWFKRDKRINWFDMTDEKTIDNVIDNIKKTYKMVST